MYGLALTSVETREAIIAMMSDLRIGAASETSTTCVVVHFWHLRQFRALRKRRLLAVKRTSDEPAASALGLGLQIPPRLLVRADAVVE